MTKPKPIKLVTYGGMSRIFKSYGLESSRRTLIRRVTAGEVKKRGGKTAKFLESEVVTLAIKVARERGSMR